MRKKASVARRIRSATVPIAIPAIVPAEILLADDGDCTRGGVIEVGFDLLGFVKETTLSGGVVVGETSNEESEALGGLVLDGVVDEVITLLAAVVEDIVDRGVKVLKEKFGTSSVIILVTVVKLVAEE